MSVVEGTRENILHKFPGFLILWRREKNSFKDMTMQIKKMQCFPNTKLPLKRNLVKVEEQQVWIAWAEAKCFTIRNLNFHSKYFERPRPSPWKCFRQVFFILNYSVGKMLHNYETSSFFHWKVYSKIHGVSEWTDISKSAWWNTNFHTSWSH